MPMVDVRALIVPPPAPLMLTFPQEIEVFLYADPIVSEHTYEIFFDLVFLHHGGEFCSLPENSSWVQEVGVPIWGY